MPSNTNDLASLLWYRLMMIDWSTFIFLFFNQTLVLYKSIGMYFIGMYVHTITFSNEERERERESEPFILFPLSLSQESKNLSGVIWKASLFQCVCVFTTVYKNLTKKRKFSVQAALSTFYSLVTYYSFTDCEFFKICFSDCNFFLYFSAPGVTYFETSTNMSNTISAHFCKSSLTILT